MLFQRKIYFFEIFLYHLIKMILGNNCSGNLIKNGYFFSKNFYRDFLKTESQKSWWEPLWYRHNFVIQEKFEKISLIDDAKLGIGDSYYCLAYINNMGAEQKKDCVIYLEPRLFKIYQYTKRYNLVNNIKVKSCYLLSQKFKSICILNDYKGKLFRLIFFIFLLTRLNNTVSLNLFNDENILATELMRRKSIFYFDKYNYINKRNYYFTLTFDCARKDSNLSSDILNSLCKTFKPIIIQHTVDQSKIKEITQINEKYNLKNSYLGFNISDQLEYIKGSSLVISVASSIAKFAIVYNKPLFLILFKTFNKSFCRYLSSKYVVFESDEYDIYSSYCTIVLRIKIENKNLDINTLNQALEVIYNLDIKNPVLDSIKS